MQTSTKFNFERVLKNIEETKRNLPKVLGNDAQLFFNASFKNQGWDGVAWKAPQRKIEGTNEFKYPIKGAARRRSRAILVGSGDLRRRVATSMRPVENSGSTQIIRWVVDLPYAAIHNYGLKMARGGNMPMRKFMGDSKKLRTLQMSKIKKAIEKIWRA